VSLAQSEGVVLEGPERAAVHAEMNSVTVKGRSSGRPGVEDWKDGMFDATVGCGLLSWVVGIFLIRGGILDYGWM
jgi:hypothetical protein